MTRSDRPHHVKLIGRRAAATLALAAAASGIVAISWRQSSAQNAPAAGNSLARFIVHASARAIAPFAFTDKDGKEFGLAAFAGKLLLVNFWATWCAPCVHEMPSLDRLQAALGGEGLMVLPLSVDGPTRKRVEPFYQDKKLTHLGIFFDDKRQAFATFDISVLPTTVLIGRDGREIGRLEGQAEWDSPEALALLRRYLTPSG